MISEPDLAIDLVRDFGTALLLGGLLGIEREKRNVREGHGTAGLRSFVLLTQLGAVGGFLTTKLGSPAFLVATMLIAAAIVIAAYFGELRARPESTGITTEVALLVACMVGALVTTGHRELAIGLGVVTAAVLAYKKPLHEMVGKLAPDDVLAGVRLLLATFVVLPLLPDEPIDPWGAIVPHKLWLLVLLISSLSLVGYAVTRWLGPGKGIAATAAAGGLVSSTALTLAFVKQSREVEGAAATRLAGGILLAWGIMFVRVVVAATVVSSVMFARLAPTFGVMAAVCVVFATICLARRHDDRAPANDLPVKNPFSLWAAMKFAALFAIVQVLVKLAQQYLPTGATYVVAGIAGLTDVDAITLTMSEQAATSPDAAMVATIAIAIAAASNTLLKAGVAAATGRGLARPVLTGTAAIFAAGAVVLLLT